MKHFTTPSAELSAVPTYRSPIHLRSRAAPLLVLVSLLVLAGRSAAGEVAELTNAAPARASASPSAAGSGRAARGDVYAVTRKTSEWIEVQFGHAKAWLRHSDVVVREGAVKRVKASSGLRVRSGSGAHHALLGTLPSGVFVADRGGSAVWRKISFEGKTGWIQGRFLASVVPRTSGRTGMIHALEGTRGADEPANHAYAGDTSTAAEVTESPTEGEAESPTEGEGEAETPALDSSATSTHAHEEGPGPGTTAIAWQNGRRVGPIEVVTINGKPVAKRTAEAFVRMRDAARRDGVTLRVNSGFRTQEEQAKLYRLYRAGRGSLAAAPGYSNHQNGLALDLNTATPGVLNWLNRNARRFGFRRTVPSERWHWELR